MGSRQLDLFGAPDDPPGVGPASVPERWATVARDLPEGVRLGTSSWSFPGWEGLVYDRRATPTELARHGLAAYARHPLLRAVGIDRTFYAPIAASDLAAYAAAVPADFRFLVKACRACTTPFEDDGSGHPRRNAHFLDPSFAADEVIAPYTEGLGAKAGPLVFQFPPQRATPRDAPAFARALGRFLAALPAGPAYAVELRDRALLTADYADVLRATGARHCVSLHPRMPPLARQAEWGADGAGPLVVRWMLRAGLSYEGARRRYAPFARIVDDGSDTRTGLAALCVAQARRGSDVFVIANNKAEGCAPETVFRLAEVIAGRG